MKKLLLGTALILTSFIVWFVVQGFVIPDEQPTATQQPTEQIVRNPALEISGIVVPHHDIVRERRAQFFKELHDRFFSSNNPETIILISPNHFEQGRANIQITHKVWRTDQGAINPARTVISSLINEGVASEETDSFTREHGIALILGNIKRTFPAATLVPVIVKRQTTLKEIERLSTALNSACRSCIVVASVDFSHYQPALLGNLHDQLSLRALQNRDVATLYNHVEADSPASLALLARWATLHNTNQFKTFDHTNSGAITNRPDEEATTHLFGWYEQGAPTIPEESVTFAVAGDMMFGRAVGYHYEKKGFTKLFDTFGDRVFWGVDAAIANLEGPISAQRVIYDKELRSLSFLFPKTSIDALTFLHLDGVSVANNHTLNHGSKGLKETRDLLKENDITSIGDPARVTDASVTYFDGEGLRLAVIGVNVLSGSDGTTTLIKKIKRDPLNRVLIFPHWGSEYALQHSPAQEALAQQWIDAGADAIIGAHPHVVQDIGAYKGKPIVYSLGNFIFDQTFSKETQTGLIVAGSFDDEGLSLYLFPHHSSHYQPALLRDEEKKKIIDRITKDVNSYLKSSDAGTFLFFPKQ
ncbi:MAG: AmmeMemoRadiSam system protein B [Candidatus Uhrbacteria bacterium]|nr:AmmeMemoRadiSam system protein B [Candidatus Uhrbacteria bacterium]